MTRPVVVVALDGTSEAHAALPLAKTLADLEHAFLKIVHVSASRVPASQLLKSLGIDSELLRGSVLDEQFGDPAESIVRAARDSHAAFIVLCTHTTRPNERRIGGTALRVLMNAPCPVVLVRPERGVAPWLLGRILVPHDGTPLTSAALVPAADLARRAGAELNVLHVAAPDADPPADVGSFTPRYVDQPQHEWPSWASEFLERVASVCPLDSVRVRIALAHGKIGPEILRSCDRQSVDLVVLAWKGAWEGEHARTVKAIIRDTECPVLIMRVAGAAQKFRTPKFFLARTAEGRSG